MSFSHLGNQHNVGLKKKISIFNLNLYFRSRFPIVRDDLLCQFCIRTAVGSAVIGMIVRTVESKVDTMTVHICSGSDPNHGKGLGNYQAEKNDVSLSVVYFTSKNGSDRFEYFQRK